MTLVILLSAIHTVKSTIFESDNSPGDQLPTETQWRHDPYSLETSARFVSAAPPAPDAVDRDSEDEDPGVRDSVDRNSADAESADPEPIDLESAEPPDASVPVKMGCNSEGMPCVLANTLTLMVCQTLPSKRYFAPEYNYGNALNAWHQFRDGPGDFKSRVYRRTRNLKAEELGIFYRIELQMSGTRIDVEGRLRNGCTFQNRRWNGYYKDSMKFLYRQYVMTLEFLTQNGWHCTGTDRGGQRSMLCEM